MKIYQAPDLKVLDNYDLSNSLFMAGGCGRDDWRQRIIDTLTPSEYVFLNPLRKDFSQMDAHAHGKQQAWEQLCLLRAERSVFWFTKNSLCPSSLFELGMVVNRGRLIYVGCQTGYEMTGRLQKYLKIHNPNTPFFVGDFLPLLDRLAEDDDKYICPSCYKHLELGNLPEEPTDFAGADFECAHCRRPLRQWGAGPEGYGILEGR